MSKLGKLRKNSENFFLKEVYSKMSPQEISDAIQLALDKQKAELVNAFNKDFARLENEYNKRLNQNTHTIIDTISVELLYELANQMDYWNLKEDTEEEKYIKDSARYRIQEIYVNTIEKINKYSKMKNEKQANKSFDIRKNKIQKEFHIKF